MQQHAITGAAGVRQAEVLDRLVLHKQHLDVLTAYVADHIHIGEVMLGAFHMRDGFDDIGVGAEGGFHHITGIASDAKTFDGQQGTLLGGPVPQLLKHQFHVFQRVAFREPIHLVQNLALIINQNALAGG